MQDKARPARSLVVALLASACSSRSEVPIFDAPPLDPEQAEPTFIDRFSAEAGILDVRAPGNGLPEANAPVDFDQPPFAYDALGPNGETIRMYDFDFKGQLPGKLYVFLQDGVPLPLQLPVLAQVPGEGGYNDFVRVYEVSTPPGYRANAIRSEADLVASQFLVTVTERVNNRVVVPAGSTAALRYGGGEARSSRAWHDGTLATVLEFEDEVPAQDAGYGELGLTNATLWASFALDPDQPGGGPASGRLLEPGTQRTHFVAEALPDEPGYSPYWMTITYHNSAFDSVRDKASAEAAPVVAGVGSLLLNAPIVFVE
jgi:hypothetical protein